MARNVKSTVKLNMPMVRKVTAAAKVSVAQTAEAIHTDVVQSQVIPRDTGALQNESTFVDLSDIGQGKAYLVSSTPYARRLYYHPEYNFRTDKNCRNIYKNKNCVNKIRDTPHIAKFEISKNT